ncbi:5-oxoprolinase subunit B family protein [Rhodovibrionaceae bacterium A322]
MTAQTLEFEGARILPVGDRGLLLRFGDAIDRDLHQAVLRTEQLVQAKLPDGVTELIPSYCALFIGYDPLVTDFDSLTASLFALKRGDAGPQKSGKVWDVPVCYEEDLAQDLNEVARLKGLTPEAVINAHLSGDYLVYMYGFTPGCAYLGGVPDAIQLPRKTAPVWDIAAGSVIIAGPQCLVTTLKMPTGWWIIGQSPFQFLRPGADDPFPLDVGDSLRFSRVSRDRFEDLCQTSASASSASEGAAP